MQPIDRKFEKFIGGPTKPSREILYVSLNRRGRIALNDNCYRHLGKPPAVYLYYSRADDKIAIEPVQSHRMPAAFPVRQRHRSGWRIDAAPFCTHNNIRFATTERFVAPEIDGDRLYLKLGETVTVRKERRTNKSRTPG